MPQKRKKERLVGQYYVWLLGMRGKVYVADGRSNQPPLGRHSLGTTSYEEALAAVKQLDAVMAVQSGRAERSLLEAQTASVLELNAGWHLYCAHVRRARVTGGARPSTSKRYRAVYDKFSKFVMGRGISSWNHVDRHTLEAYAAHLDDEGYAYATEYLELTTLKQAMKWFVENGHLPARCRIHLPVSKPSGTGTYSWQPTEVRAIIDFCEARPKLYWLGYIMTALAWTGLRISELASLRWSDVDLENNIIVLTDESTRAPSRLRRKARLTKNRRSRSFPIHGDLRRLLLSVPRHPDGFILHGAKGSRLKPDRIRTVLIRDVLSELKSRFPTPDGEVGFEHGRLHSFRHAFCSLCANAGVPEQVVMSWLGHSHSTMVRHYYHLHDEESQRQMQRLQLASDVGDSAS